MKIKIVFIIFTMVVFVYSFQNFNFGPVAVNKIEEQRREHINLFHKESRVYHNKFFYFTFQVTDIYLQYLSPAVFFSVNMNIVISLITLTIFYCGIIHLLQLKKRNLLLFWTIWSPILPAILILRPTALIFYSIQSPILIFASIILTKKLYGHLFK